MSLIHKWIFIAGQNLRNPSLGKIYRELKETEHWPKEKLDELQWKRFMEIIDYAYHHSPYYKKKWDNAGIHPDHINSPKDISKIPIITKQELIRHNDEIHTDWKGKKFYSVTSGTTGESLSFWKDEVSDSHNRAAIFRGYSWYDVRPWDRNGYFWGFSFSPLKKWKTRLLDFMVNRFRLFSYEEPQLKKFARKLRSAVYLEGYSSTIYQVAKLINEKNLPKPRKLKMVKGTSEKIYPHYHEESLRAFGHKIIGEYGAAESGLIAFECPQGNLHIATEGVYVEEVDNEIIVTNLIMKSFPVIRYKLGDYIRLKSKDYKCVCGMEHPVIEEITGRIGKNVYGATGIYPSLYFYYVFKNLEKNHHIKLSYQVIQKEKGRLEFFFERPLAPEEENALQKEVKALFGDDIKFSWQVRKKIFDSKGKFKDFISYID